MWSEMYARGRKRSETTELLSELDIQRAEVLTDISAERERQDRKWGIQNHEDDRWAVILGEEFGEAMLAINESGTGDVRSELVQVAAVAVAWIECLDRRYDP